MLTVYSLLTLFTVAYALPQVKVGRTNITGRSASTNVEFFGGISYAEPPVGALRLRDPLLKTRLNTTAFNASDYGKICVQPLVEPSIISEDCLTINIYRPAGLRPGTSKLPVFFWTYGGAFVIGSSSQFNGTNLVIHSIERGTPIIYVSFNYRLGPLGFPQGQEADDRRALNLALKDQIAALEWVQANIHLFGGDKDKVTIFGESAGAIMTGILYFNPELIGRLARGAISESGFANSPPTYPAARNEPLWQGFVGKVGSCASVAASGAAFSCLRNATTEEITAAVLQSITPSELFWAPTLDTGRGSVYLDYASRLYAKGRFARLPFIAGTNGDEGTIFASQQPLSEEELRVSLLAVHSPPVVPQAKLVAAVDQMLSLYLDDPALGSPFGTGSELFGLPSSYKRSAAFNGDLTFDATHRLWSHTAAKYGVKSYGYHFVQPQPVPQLGVFHGSEIPYVYGDFPADQPQPELSTVIQDYWISFAVSLNPNDGRGAVLYIVKPVLLQLQTGNLTVVKDNYRSEQIGFMNKNNDVFLR